MICSYITVIFFLQVHTVNQRQICVPSFGLLEDLSIHLYVQVVLGCYLFNCLLVYQVDRGLASLSAIRCVSICPYNSQLFAASGQDQTLKVMVSTCVVGVIA